jgi:uncharacterized protein (TIGR00290 family)
MHGVRIELLKQQAKSVNLPLQIVYLPYPCNNDEYVQMMTSFIADAKKNDIECFAFGDLFLENVREYRENLFADTGIDPVFPIWGIPTKILSEQMISEGLKAVITCINSEHIGVDFIGRFYDRSFVNDVPENVDPCGENGEFHSFAFDGPMFQSPIEIMLGETVYRDMVCFKDILPSTLSTQSECGTQGFDPADYAEKAASYLNGAFVVGANAVGVRCHGRFLPSVYCGASDCSTPPGYCIEKIQLSDELIFFHLNKLPTKLSSSSMVLRGTLAQKKTKIP